MEERISKGDGHEEPITWDDVHALMDDLRDMARRLLALEGNAQSLQPTGLVLTALRRQRPATADWGEVTWPNRKYFFGAAHEAMRRALIDHGRKRRSKRALRPVRLEELHLENLVKAAEERPEQVEALALALERLRERHPDWAEVAEYRYLSGYTVEETARITELSERTVRRYWSQARLLLHDEVLRILNEGDTTAGLSHEVAE